MRGTKRRKGVWSLPSVLQIGPHHMGNTEAPKEERLNYILLCSCQQLLRLSFKPLNQSTLLEVRFRSCFDRVHRSHQWPVFNSVLVRDDRLLFVAKHIDDTTVFVSNTHTGTIQTNSTRRQRHRHCVLG